MKLSVLAHISIFSLSLVVPAAVLTIHFADQIRELDRLFSSTAEVELLERDVAILDLSIQQTLVLSDLVFGSAQTYLVYGARNQIDLARDKAKQIARLGLLGSEATKLLDQGLQRLDREHSMVLTLDEIELNQRLSVFLPEYDQVSASIVDQMMILLRESEAAVTDRQLLSQAGRDQFAVDLGISILIYIVYVFVIVWLHLRVLSIPIKQLSEATIDRAYLGTKPIPEAVGPVEYKSLNRAFREYDAQLRWRLDGERLISLVYDSLREVEDLDAFSKVLESLLRTQVQCESIAVDGLALEGESIDELQDRRQWTSSNESLGGESQESRYETLEYLLVIDATKNVSSADSRMVGSPIGQQRHDCRIILKPFNRPMLVVRLNGLVSALKRNALEAWFQQVADAVNNQLKRLTLERELQARVQEQTKALEAQIEETEKAIGARSRFFSNISHELKTPFNSILGFIDMLEQSVEGPDEKEMVQHIAHSSHNLYRLLSDYLELSLAESGKILSDPGPVRLASFFRGLADRFKSWANGSVFKFDEKNLPDPDIEVETDATLLTKVLKGLIVYASSVSISESIFMSAEIKAAGEGCVELWVHFELADSARAEKMFGALSDPYDNSGRVGDGNLINNMELAAAAIYFQILGGSFDWNSDSTICSAQLPLFVTTPRHLEANALAQIAALREAHPFEIVAKKPRELPLSLANLVERCGLTVSSDVDQLTEEDGFLIRLMDPSERAVIDAGNGGSRDDNEAWQGRCRIVFLYQPGEEEIAQRSDLRLLGIATWPVQMTMSQLYERLR
ncbi:MAG: HAMP domain-containing sensor histidine kinase, partial [Opitutae bacterium]